MVLLTLLEKTHKTVCRTKWVSLLRAFSKILLVLDLYLESFQLLVSSECKLQFCYSLQSICRNMPAFVDSKLEMEDVRGFKVR